MSREIRLKILRVGDPHVKVANLEESHRLMQFVLDKAKELKVDRIEILGDLFHTHAIVRLEVLEFWRKWLWIISEQAQTVVLVGNHDQSGNHNSDAHALAVFCGLNPGKLKIIDSPFILQGCPIGYMPYIHDNASFIAQANSLADKFGATVLVSHTTYEGSKYDNGMYAPDGVDPSALDGRFSTLISGHVHAEQEYGRVWYPGTARWDTAADANRRKGIWLCRHEAQTGVLLEREFISTGDGVCTALVSIEWKEGEKAPEIPTGAKVLVELVGSSSWIAKEKENLKGQVQIRTKITDSKKSENRQAGGSFQEFLAKIWVSTADREGLLAMAREMGIV